MGANVCGVSLEPSSSDKLLFPQLINDRSSKNLFSSHFVQEYCDINDFTELQKVVKRFQPEVVFHLAAQSLVRSGYSYPLNTWSTNVQGSVNIMRSLMGLDYVCSVARLLPTKFIKIMNGSLDTAKTIHSAASILIVLAKPLQN